MNKKIIRKRWIKIFGNYGFDDVVELAGRMNIEVVTAFKPGFCVDIHFKGIGKREDFVAFETDLKEKGHKVFNRCPKTGFQFD